MWVRSHTFYEAWLVGMAGLRFYTASLITNYYMKAGYAIHRLVDRRELKGADLREFKPKRQARFKAKVNVWLKIRMMTPVTTI